MRRILLSLVIVFGVVAMVAGATRAVFTSADNVNGNLVSTVRLHIDAREVINKPLHDVSLLPGNWGDVGVVDLFNDGGSDQRQWMYLQNVSADPLCAYVNLKVGYSWNSPGYPHRMDVVFGTYQLSNLTGAVNAIEVGRSNPVPAGWTTRLVQQPQVDISAPNDVQNHSCTWDEVFTATQPGLGLSPT